MKYPTDTMSWRSYNQPMVVCLNCHHKRSFHKKVDGSAWCTLSFCSCKEFIEQEVEFNRRTIHEALDQFLDDLNL